MAQYIDKAAVVAEIKKLMYRYDSEYDEDSTEVKAAKGNVCHEILCTIDSLEVEEVDLEKELESWRHNHFHGRRDIFANGEYLKRVSQLELAKHFYELGIKAQKGEEV